MLLFYSNKVFINIGLELDKHYRWQLQMWRTPRKTWKFVSVQTLSSA